MPYSSATYTMNTTTPSPTQDHFQLEYHANDTEYGPYDIYVVNGEPVGKQLGGCNCGGKSIVETAGGGNPATDDPGSGTLAGLYSLPDSRNPNRSRANAGIAVASGNVFYSVADYTTSGENPLAFLRYYNSLGNVATQYPLPETTTTLSSTLSTELGVNWRSNYDRYLKLISGSAVIAERPDGQQLMFTLKGSVWTPDSDIDVTLTHSGAEWTLTDSTDTVETYKTATLLPGISVTALYAALDSIKSRNGYTQTLDYSSGVLTGVSDSYNRSLTFTYSNGLLHSVTTPDGLVLTYTYTAAPAAPGYELATASYSTTPESGQSYYYGNSELPFALTEIGDEDGNDYANWSYDGYGRGVGSYLGSGANAVSISYNPDGSTTVTNALGVADTYTFATLKSVPKTGQIARAASGTTSAATESFTYDGHGYVASQTDWNGNKTAFANNIHGLPTTINEAVGTSVARTTTITYDSTWVHLPATIVTPGLTSTFTYDDGGELLKQTLADTTTTTAPYATGGQKRTWTNSWSNFLLASTETPNLHTTKFGYDSSGALTSVTDALSHVTKITSHTGGGLPETIVDPNGVTTTLTYDARQRLTGSTVSGSTGTFKTSWAYDAAGNLVQTTLPDNSYLANTYDAAHRLTMVTDALGNNFQYVLDALGDRTEIFGLSGSGGFTWEDIKTFDALGRELVDRTGGGQTTTLTYDPSGNTLTVIDGNGNTTTNAYDPLNRLSTSTDANGSVTRAAYDAHNRVVSVTDANGHTTSYARDGFGDVLQQTSPDSGKTLFYYDADANLTEQLNASGTHTYHTFDALDRVLTTTYPGDTAENVAFTYDQTSGHGLGIGRLTSVADAAGTLSRAFDERGNLLSEKRVRGSVTMTTSYSYDAASRTASITYPSGNKLTYSRDAAGQVTNIATPTATVASNITHLPFGPVNGFTYGNGVPDIRRFDLAYNMAFLNDGNPGANVQFLNYQYDAAYNLTSTNDSLNNANSQTFGYDALNRLTSATAGDYGTFLYTYDKVGNRLTEGRTDGAPTDNYNYVAGTNRLSGLSIGGTTIEAFTYTPTGNIVDFMGGGQPTVSLNYNKANRIGTIAENGAQIAAYTYDGFGQRLVKTFAGTPASGTLFAYGQDGSLLEETNVNGAAQVDYIYLDGFPVGDLSPASKTLYYLHTDHLGTPQLATNSAKATVWKATYEPFGWGNSVSGTFTQNVRFPGQYFDSETGSYHNGFRDYVAIFGRYGQADPIGLEGGMNAYIYVNDNPVENTDRFGLQDNSMFGMSGSCRGYDCIPTSAFPQAPRTLTQNDVTNGFYLAGAISSVMSLGTEPLLMGGVAACLNISAVLLDTNPNPTQQGLSTAATAATEMIEEGENARSISTFGQTLVTIIQSFPK